LREKKKKRFPHFFPAPSFCFVFKKKQIDDKLWQHAKSKTDGLNFFCMGGMGCGAVVHGESGLCKGYV
jgi:hypothetical protein